MPEVTEEMVKAFRKAALADGDGIEAGLDAVLDIVEQDYLVLPRFAPRRHEFVRSSDPNFGSAFGGGCAAPVDDTVCGWPEHAHRQEPS